MRLFPFFSSSVTDDRGTRHTSSWSEEAKNPAREFVSRRVTVVISDEFRAKKQGLNQRVSARQVLTLLAPTLILIALMLIGAAFSLPVLWMCWLFPLAFGWSVMRAFDRDYYDKTYQRGAEVAVEEGVCGACWYDLRALPREPDGMVVCPECHAAWRADRIRPGGTTASEAIAPTSETERDIDAVARRMMDELPAALRDAKGKLFSLASSRDLRRRAARTTGEQRDRLRDAARVLRSTGRWKRLTWHVRGLGLVLVMVLFMPRVSNAWSSASTMDILWMLAFGYVIVYSGASLILNVSRSDRTDPDRGRALLLARSLCPSCAASLAHATPDASGDTECPECGAAWKMPTRPESLRVVRCPACRSNASYLLRDSSEQLVCVACGHLGKET